MSRLVADLSSEQQDAVNLMVSELATNALVHASSGFDVDVDRSEIAVTISVTDRGDGTPAMQSPTSSEPHGRGLRIVEALSDDWGTNASDEAGKTVWFQMVFRDVETEAEGNVEPAVRGSEERAAPARGRTPSAPSRPLPGRGRSDKPQARNRAAEQGRMGRSNRRRTLTYSR